MSAPKGLKKKFEGLKIEVSEQPADTYSVTKSGTFREGDVEVSKKGLLVKGESPQATPKGAAKAEIKPVKKFSTSPRPLRIEDGPMSLELKDLKFLSVLGDGSSGVVKKALHVPTGGVLAVKVIQLDIEPNVRKQILLELKTLHKTQCEYIVSFFDAFYDEGSFFIALEFMDSGALSNVLTKAKTIPENVLGKIAFQVLSGLNYLHKKLHLVHRDIKPSNLLISGNGQVKISDFGVSGQLAHTLSKCVSWVGTVTYMSPERISGSSYSYDSDIWSVGLTLVECALGHFPYGKLGGEVGAAKQQLGTNPGFWELVDLIVKEQPPTLPNERFSKDFCSFVDISLQKTPEERPSAQSLLNHAWIKKTAADQLDLGAWLQQWIDQ
eukprot:TRINITY_DN2536_c0_g1_i1.p1 TRINITY_DN2536_c0_g1~~TRINITY_DN2536_c0_g1_i1.p1  ORF type:complete len:381 (-),score=102.82 TRINITY_DN2536_c0_g1_i1:821-1963(-)